EEIEDYIKRLKQAAEENRQLFLGAIRTLAAAIDAKDPYTRGHSERVTRYSEIIATELGLPTEEVENIQIAALLHDVGKIGISDSILQKPGILTEAEYAVMKQHPELGGNIMSQIQQLKHIIPGMRYHHESLDGSGYPRGLKGDEIPLAARIIGVADAFDAMTTERPYQKPLATEEALEIINRKAGQKFDRRVVDALAAAVSRGLIDLPNPEDVKKPRYVTSN
ncbi:MAG TPA: HD-GYP domain-containing protein, partial [Acidobacteriota bacterium]|nr:HD-GYP domain-containing protein [Acidobacteriota bacterium]